jgi:hypothetical protein
MTPYKLAPRDQTGKAVLYKNVQGNMVRFEEIDLLNLTPDAVDSLLMQYDYNALSPVPYGSRVFKFRYTTQDRGVVTEATGTIGVPANAKLPDKELPFLIWLHGTCGFADPCAPSRALEGQAFSALFASLGFISVAPDYTGMSGVGDPSTAPNAYLVAEQVAIGAWDALRAMDGLLKDLRTGVKSGKKVAIWGASQGGHAALFTEQYAPYYAPEYEVPAVVAAVPPSVLMPLAQKAMQAFSPPTISFLPLLTTVREWYNAPLDLTGVVSNDAPYHFASTLHDQIYIKGTDCNTGASYEDIKNHPEQQKVDYIYKKDFIDAVLAGNLSGMNPWDCYLDENSLATSSVKPLRFTPTFMVYSEKDDLVVTEPMRQDFDRLCGLGYKLKYLECKNAGHADGAVWSIKEQLGWIKDRLSGLPLPDDMCKREAPVCCSATPKGKCD